MSREIKFRAWNKEEKIMCYDNEDNSASYRDWVVASKVWLINNTLKDWEYSSYERMQYTWMYLSENQKIYEWDLIKCVENNQIREVYFNDIELQYKIYNSSNIHLPLYNTPVEEIVWNIYENPELIPE